MRTFTTAALAGVALTGALLGAPSAAADPADCSAAGLASTASGVLNDAGAYLASHPDANEVLTNAVEQSPEDARNSVRGYFAGHLGELTDLQHIAQPLTDLRNQCGVSVSPGQLAALFDTLAA